MLCETCRWTERPGFVRRPAEPDPGPAAARDVAADFIYTIVEGQGIKDKIALPAVEPTSR